MMIGVETMRFVVKTFFRSLYLMAAVFFVSQAAHADGNPRVAFKTDHGTILIELFVKEAPISVANFLEYVDSGFYNGTIFHRVIPGFVVQGGGMTYDFSPKPTRDPIKNESNNGLSNSYGTIAMARTNQVDSATSQFYINIKDNPALDAKGNKLGYTVFGKVVTGMEVVNRIVDEPRGMYPAFPDAPNYAVRILEAKRVDQNYQPEAVPQSTNSPLKNSNVSNALVKP
jgi:peptidyl-prolyl cis-trans isomerase A (cyclophilin A)